MKKLTDIAETYLEEINMFSVIVSDSKQRQEFIRRRMQDVILEGYYEGYRASQGADVKAYLARLADKLEKNHDGDSLDQEMSHVEDLRCISRVIKLLEK